MEQFKRKQNLPKMVEERNLKLDEFLLKYFPGARWIGNENTPAIIVDKKVLSCHLKNFYLVFTDAPREGEVLFQHNINQELTTTEVKRVEDWIERLEIHRDVFRVKVKGVNLFLSGYNFLDKSDKDDPKMRYPVFAPFHEKVYFSEEMAQSIVDSYKMFVPLEIY